MNRRIKQQHCIDILFMLVVFLLFAFSGVTLLVLATRFYQSTVAKSEENDHARVAAAYVREVLHQNDSSDDVMISEFEGVQCISVPQAEDYVLYLYYYDGELRELYTKDGAIVTPENGQKIIELDRFSITEIAQDLIEVECEDHFGNVRQVLISHMSGEKGETYEEAGK